jgi:hypothetical protein
MRIKLIHIFSWVSILALLLLACGYLKTHTKFYDPIINDLKTENYAHAISIIDKSKETNKYLKKDRVLYYLDKGIVLYYQKEYDKSNQYLEDADRAMEELFTKSISKAALSLLLNDNVLDYFGDIYENLYVNIFKSINYLKLDKFDDAYVEVKRVNDKLRILDDKYSDFVDQMNKSDSATIKIEKKPLKFYDDVLAHYISYLIFRAEGEYDNSRISYQSLKSAWRAYPEIYSTPLPKSLKKKSDKPGVDPAGKEKFLNIIAFTGNGPNKVPVGGQITTYNNYIHVSDLSYFKNFIVINFPGMKQGYHFKFAFPDMAIQNSGIAKINVYLDNKFLGKLEILEDLGKIANKTFEMKKHITYLKTVLRTVVKGLISVKRKEELRKKMGVEKNFLLGGLLNLGVDAAVDATENPDLRCWRTMPQHCYIGEFKLVPGKYNISIRFYNQNGLLVKTQNYDHYQIEEGLNLIETNCLN